MEPIQSFAQLTAHLKKLNHRKRIAVVCANDPNTEYAITRALEEGIAEFLMIGDSAILEKYPTLKQYPEYIKIIHIEDSDEAAREAVRIVREGGADILMKGIINTDNLLHAILDKEKGLLPKGKILTHLAVEPEDDPCTNYLKDILFGNLPSYTCEKHKLNKQGSTQGVLRGGNMAVAYGLRGTPYDIPAEGTVLFIEDVSERPHAIERMMYNLKLGGVLEKLSGLIVGQFTEYEEDCSLGKELYAALADLVKEYDYPVCFNFPVGHVTHNLPLINGAKVEFTVGKKNVELKFIC